MLGPYGAMASFDQDFLAAGLGLEYEIVRNQNRIVPFARLRYIYGKQTGLTESGNSGTETTLDALEGSGFASSLGTEFSRRIVRQGMSWVPRVSVAWVHEFGDVDFATGSVYNFGATNRFRLGSAKDDRDRFRLGTDLRADLDKRWSLVLGYTLDVSSHTTLHGVAAGAEYRF